MSYAFIDVKNLSKVFRVPERESGLKAAVRSLLHPTFIDVPAVNEISFEIGEGEKVGLLGPNGAGKTTTLKILSGLLHPNRGQVQVMGFLPSNRQPAFLNRIGMILGNKSQMIWDIPPLDTFHVLGEIYRLSPATMRKNLDELVNLLDMQPLLTKPVRNLSLGERMKCELAAGLLHHPRLLFLDEPTLGLDVSMQNRLRTFIAEYNRRYGATILLTSHYMADITALCSRVILIHQGKIIYDGQLNQLAQNLAPFKLVRLAFDNGSSPNNMNWLPPTARIIEQQDHQLTLRVEREAIAMVTSSLLNNLPVIDLTVEDPPIEAVIDRIYQDGAL